MERGGWKPHVEICPACPRCGSSNTKFCYYNNYSLTQPRYFCKGCRRYWTKGGSLRNVPVGGGCRKTRRGKAVWMARQGVSSRVVTSGDHRCPLNGHNNSYRADDSSSTNPSSSNIDLAVVYANFLNQQPQPQPQEISANDHIIMNPLPDISNHPVFDFSSNLGVEFFGTATHENCWSTMDTDHSKDLMYICGLELVGHDQKQQTTHPTSIAKDQQIISGYDELAAQGMVINNLNQISNSMQLLGFEKDLDLSGRDEFMGNSSSMFEDLPTYGTTHSFSSNP